MKNYIIISLFILVLTNSFSLEWKESIKGLSQEEITTLEKGDYIIRSEIDYSKGLDLLPEIDITNDFLEDIKLYNPELSVEMLYLFKRPGIEDNTELLVLLLNKIRQYSKQVGIEYFSNRKQAMSLLVEDCYFTTADGKTKLPDPVVTELVPFNESYYYQKDTTFGGNRYKLFTRTTNNSIWLQMENLKSLNVYTFFKALDAGGQRVNFIIHPVGDYILVYAIAQIKEEPKIKSILGYEVNIPYSFQRRMNSMVLWYKNILNN